MSTPRERLATALEGGTPDITPYSIYSWMMNRETEQGKAAWQDVLDRGLALCHHCSPIGHAQHGVRVRIIGIAGIEGVFGKRQRARES